MYTHKLKHTHIHTPYRTFTASTPEETDPQLASTSRVSDPALTSPSLLYLLPCQIIKREGKDARTYAHTHKVVSGSLPAK